MKKEDNTMIQLNSRFQREIFQKLIKNFKGSIKASNEINIPASSIRGYKNLYFNSIPKKIVDKFLEINILTRKELRKNTLLTFNKQDEIKKNLDYGRRKRQDNLQIIKKNIPSLNEITYHNYIDIKAWFKKYKALAESGFRKLKVQYLKKYILIRYSNFAKTKFKDFEVRIPNKFLLDDEFIYFFGLWCGDRVGGKRMGVANKNKEINEFTQKFLEKNYQKVERILYITKGYSEPGVNYDKKFEIDSKGGWVLSIHSNNGILASFFHYLQKDLSFFLTKITNKYPFFAGLFDAEGNVSLYNRSFRWACQNEKLVQIYSKFLKEMDLYNRYDGSCLISYNLKEFYRKIFPYLKHKEKINYTSFLCRGVGNPPKIYLKVLKYIKQHPCSTSNEISKGLKRNKVYSELKLLRNFNFILHQDYPYKFKLNKSALKILGE